MKAHMMTATRMAVVILLIASAAPAMGGMTTAGPLRYDFYSSSCPKAEQIIRKTTEGIISKDPTMGATLLYTFFYDCFREV